MHTWGVTAGTVRHDDDAGDGSGPYQTVSGVPWSTVLGDDGGEKVTAIKVSVGFSAGYSLSALLAELTVNDTTFDFAG